MVPAIAAAGGVRILEFTFNAGVRMHSNWMVKKWTLSDQDLKAVTISFFVRACCSWRYSALGLTVCTAWVFPWRVTTTCLCQTVQSQGASCCWLAA